MWYIWNSSAAAPEPSTAFFRALSDLEAASKLTVCGCSLRATLAFWLVDRVLFVAHTNTAPVITQVVHPTIDVVVDHLTGLEEGLLDIEACFS